VGQKHEIVTNNIISFEMIVKLQYKDCEMTFKRIDHICKIDAVDITEKGYIVEYSETFLAKEKICPYMLNFLNNVVNHDLDIVYQKLIAKKKFVDKIRNN